MCVRASVRVSVRVYVSGWVCTCECVRMYLYVCVLQWVGVYVGVWGYRWITAIRIKLIQVQLVPILAQLPTPRTHECARVATLFY